MLAGPSSRQLEDAYNMTIGETLAAYNDNDISQLKINMIFTSWILFTRLLDVPKEIVSSEIYVFLVWLSLIIFGFAEGLYRLLKIVIFW